MSIYYLGALVGCLWGGSISDKHGRKIAVFLGTLWGIIGTALLTAAQNTSKLTPKALEGLITHIPRLVSLRSSHCWSRHRPSDQRRSLLGFGTCSFAYTWQVCLFSFPSQLYRYCRSVLDSFRRQLRGWWSRGLQVAIPHWLQSDPSFDPLPHHLVLPRVSSLVDQARSPRGSLGDPAEAARGFGQGGRHASSCCRVRRDTQSHCLGDTTCHP